MSKKVNLIQAIDMQNKLIEEYETRIDRALRVLNYYTKNRVFIDSNTVREVISLLRGGKDEH